MRRDASRSARLRCRRERRRSLIPAVDEPGSRAALPSGNPPLKPAALAWAAGCGPCAVAGGVGRGEIRPRRGEASRALLRERRGEARRAPRARGPRGARRRCGRGPAFDQDAIRQSSLYKVLLRQIRRRAARRAEVRSAGSVAPARPAEEGQGGAPRRTPLRPLPPRLLGCRSLDLGRARRRRPVRLGRDAPAADPVARNPQAPAGGPDRQPRRPACSPTAARWAAPRSPLKEMPPHLPKAFIAIEDRRFRSHYGIDPLGLVRAVVANVLRRGVSQGGSTITQQLAKNLFLTQERTHDAQAAGGGAGALARAQILQGRDPRALSQPGLFRRRRLRRRGGGAALFRQVGAQRHAGRSRAARRPGQVAVAARADPQLRRRRGARAARARRDGRGQAHHRRRREDGDGVAAARS